MFEGDALLRRMVRYGLLGEEEKKLDYVLQVRDELGCIHRLLWTRPCEGVVCR